MLRRLVHRLFPWLWVQQQRLVELENAVRALQLEKDALQKAYTSLSLDIGSAVLASETLTTARIEAVSTDLGAGLASVRRELEAGLAAAADAGRRQAESAAAAAVAGSAGELRRYVDAKFDAVARTSEAAGGDLTPYATT